MRTATTVTDKLAARARARRRQGRIWAWATGIFYGSLLVWFFGFVLGLRGLIEPYL
ncbi:MAG: hypothetical protein ACR2QM_03555 [Longimicrobiales bacterium]